MIYVLLIACAVIVSIWLAVELAGQFCWRRKTSELQKRLASIQRGPSKGRIEFDSLDVLPPPVGRFLRIALHNGQPLVRAARIRHCGLFNLASDREQWRPFVSEQWVVVQRPGFVWNARVSMVPGIRVRVHDAYMAGEGHLNAALFGLINVAAMRGRGDLAQGELLRFLAESAWYPTALLPGQGIQWTAIDDRSAEALIRDEEASASLIFTFDEQGLIDTVRSSCRSRMVDGQAEPTPWEGRFWNYQLRNGMRIPLEGEVSWLLPQRKLPYWQGRIEAIEYDFSSRD